MRRKRSVGKLRSFRISTLRRCAQCHGKLVPGQETWAYDYHVFDSVDCVETWATTRREA